MEIIILYFTQSFVYYWNLRNSMYLYIFNLCFLKSPIVKILFSINNLKESINNNNEIFFQCQNQNNYFGNVLLFFSKDQNQDDYHHYRLTTIFTFRNRSTQSLAHFGHPGHINQNVNHNANYYFFKFSNTNLKLLSFSFYLVYNSVATIIVKIRYLRFFYSIFIIAL